MPNELMVTQNNVAIFLSRSSSREEGNTCDKHLSSVSEQYTGTWHHSLVETHANTNGIHFNGDNQYHASNYRTQEDIGRRM